MWVPRLPFVVFALVAPAVGFAPLAFFLDYPKLLLYCSLACALTSLLRVRRMARFVTARPRPAEVVLAQAGAIYTSATLGLSSVFIYGVAYGLSRLIALLMKLVGLGWKINPSDVGFYSSIVFIAIGVVALGSAVELTAERLCPPEGQTRSAYRVLLARRGGAMILVYAGMLVLLAGSIVCYKLWGADIWWPYAVIQLLLMLVGTAAWPPISRASENEGRAERTEALAALFRQLDFATGEVQKTGQEAVDPFLADADFIATKADRQFLVQVKSGPTPSAAWRSISALRTAALVLDQERQPVRHETEAVLVLLADTSPDEAIVELARRELVRVLHLTNSEVDRIGRGTYDPELMNRLSRLLEEPVEAAAQRLTTNG
jgi:hypothetical protein